MIYSSNMYGWTCHQHTDLANKKVGSTKCQEKAPTERLEKWPHGSSLTVHHGPQREVQMATAQEATLEIPCISGREGGLALLGLYNSDFEN